MVRGYETLSENPDVIRMTSALVLLSGSRGFEGLTLKAKVNVLSSKDFISRLAVKEITGSTATFLSVASIIGPPGLMGATGPTTDVISIGS